MGNTGRLVVGVAIAVIAGGWIALGRLDTPPLLAWAAVASMGFTVAGWMLQREGRVNHFTVFAGVVIGLVGAALVGGLAVLIGLAALALMIGYARASERRGPFGQVVLAALVGVPFAYGAVAVGRPAAGIVPWILAAWLQMIHALVIDLDSESADRAGGGGRWPSGWGDPGPPFYRLSWRSPSSRRASSSPRGQGTAGRISSSRFSSSSLFL